MRFDDILELRSDGARTRRVFEEANARYETRKLFWRSGI
jgi:hypothetical protein